MVSTLLPSLTKLISACPSGKHLIFPLTYDSWAILRQVVDAIYEQKDLTGDYIFMKDPNKAVMKLYKKTSEELSEDENDEELWLVD